MNIIDELKLKEIELNILLYEADNKERYYSNLKEDYIREIRSIRHKIEQEVKTKNDGKSIMDNEIIKKLLNLVHHPVKASDFYKF